MSHPESPDETQPSRVPTIQQNDPIEGQPATEAQPPIESNPKSAESPNNDGRVNIRDATWWRYKHMLGMAVAIAAVLFVCVSVIGGQNSEFVFIPLAAGVFSTVVLVGIWSVFGAGGYLTRMLVSLAVSLIPALGFLLGLLVQQIGNNWEFARYEDILMIAAGFPVVSFAAQLPFWFFRGFFGWQFVYRDEMPNSGFNLRDIFALTFVCALSFAAPQMAINFQPDNRFGNGDLTTDYQLVDQPDGTQEYEMVTLTDPDEIRELKRQREQQLRFGMMVAYGGVGLYFFVFSLLAVPVLLLMFRTKNSSSGCVWSALYAIGFYCFIGMIFVILTGGQITNGEIVFYPAILIASCTAAVAIPLAVSRAGGFELTSLKRYNLMKQESANGQPSN